MLQNYLNSKGYRVIEGYSQQVPKQVERLKELIKNENIKNVMEIGFNAGHSAELFLSTNPNIHLTSFDIGVHDYMKVGKTYIDNTYPNRHNLIIGDSTISVPKYIEENANKKFDLIFIDGGHDYKVAKADVINCKKLAHKDSIVIIDDIVKNGIRSWNFGPNRVWGEELQSNNIIESNFEEYEVGRGMGWGKYKV